MKKTMRLSGGGEKEKEFDSKKKKLYDKIHKINEPRNIIKKREKL